MTDNVLVTTHADADKTAANLPVSTSMLPAAPLIAGENADDYNDLFRQLTGTLQPCDPIEAIWVRDVVDLVWEVFRLRRLKAYLIRSGAYQGLAQVLKPLVKWETHEELARAWSTGEAEAVETVRNALASAGHTVETVMAHTISARIEIIERMDRMTAMAEARRDNILHQLEQRQAALAKTLRGTIRRSEDAERQTETHERTGRHYDVDVP